MGNCSFFIIINYIKDKAIVLYSTESSYSRKYIEELFIIPHKKSLKQTAILNYLIMHICCDFSRLVNWETNLKNEIHKEKFLQHLPTKYST